MRKNGNDIKVEDELKVEIYIKYKIRYWSTGFAAKTLSMKRIII